MKRLLLAIQMGIIALVPGTAGSANDTEKQKLLIGSAFREPYIELPDQGTVWSLLKQTERSLGVEFVFADAPAARSLLLADSGVLDGDIIRVAEIDQTFPHLVRVPTVVSINEIGAFGWDPTLKINSFEEIAKAETLIVGTQIGRKYIERELRGHAGRLFIEDVTQLFTLLEQKRLELVILDRQTAYYIMGDRLGRSLFEASDRPLATRDYYLFLHERHRNLVPRVAAALEAALRHRQTAASPVD